jgi:ankyrin repeat protein
MNDSILHKLIRQNDYSKDELTEYCLKYSEFINWHNSYGHQPLHELLFQAIEEAKLVEFTLILINNGADINGRKRGDWTPLMIAAKKGLLQVSELLIGKGAILHLQNSDGFTAFQLACTSEESKADEIGILLLENAPEIYQIKAFNGRSPLFSAVKHGHLRTTGMILSKMNLSLKEAAGLEEHGVSLLENARQSGNKDLINLLTS